MRKIPVEVLTRGSYLDPDNQRIGFNLRRWVLRRRRQWGLTNRYLAEMAGIHPCSLSRILRGYGASEVTLIRLAEALRIEPTRLVIGLSRPERYPKLTAQIKPNSSKRARAYGVAVRSIDALLADEAVLRTFVGGVYDDATLAWLKRSFWTIKEQSRKRREACLDRKSDTTTPTGHYR